MSIVKHALLVMLLGIGLYTHAAENQYANAIASAHPLATEAGMQVLAEGGNAFDAAVTVAAVLAVVEPYGSGIGGGGFWLLHRASDGRQVMVDGRERAPLAAHSNMYLDAQGKVTPGLSLNGPLAAGIPGQVAAMVHLQQHYGSLPMTRLLQPAIRYAQEGFPANRIYRKLAKFRKDVLLRYPASRDQFLIDGDIPRSGDIIRQPDLATTLRHITTRGKAGFYQGEVASKLVQGVRDAGGIWTHADLQQYRVVEREPLHFGWQGLRITSAPLPSSGGVVLAQILGMLASRDLAGLEEHQRIHLLVEAMRRAYRDRATYLGDTDHVAVPVGELISGQYLEKLAEDMDSAMATPSEMLSPVAVKTQAGRDTTHYSILDRHGNRVAATLSINYPFGSGFVVPGTGVLLNDEMDDFAIQPDQPNAYGLVGNEANAIAPGKRMLSSMSPTFIETDQRLAVVGTPGGSRIITMVLQAILGFSTNMTATEIVGMPRYHHQYLPDYIQLEPDALADTTRQQLQDMGHTLKELSSSYGNMQLIVHDFQQAQTSAASDPRGLGQASVD